MDVDSGNFHANEQTTEPAMAPPNRQDSSLFFQQLPTEIRLKIYSQLFRSTRLSFAERHGHAVRKKRRLLACLRPAPNSLSLLRVCRRVTDEIGDSWLGQVLFIFRDPEIMLDKLTSLDSQNLSKLRHMRYSEERLDGVLRARNGNPLGHGYHLAHILKLLPGLCLDRLTVFGEARKEIRYRELDDLIKHSNGWKELCFLSHDSAMLGYPKLGKGRYGQVPEEFLRAPQPSTWRQALSHRDGPTASVRIYRASDAAGHGSRVPKPATCQLFVDQVAEPYKKYGVEEDAALMAPGEKQKELLVVARRGKGVDYVEKPGSPLFTADIRKDWPGMTWGQIRALDVGWDDVTRSIVRPNGLGSPNHDEAAGSKVDNFERIIKVDTYDHVDEYQWSLFYL